jgi:hypothetical protein
MNNFPRPQPPKGAVTGGSLSYSSEPPFSFNNNKKFDIQLSQALQAEKRLAEIFSVKKIEKIELKTETWQWEQTGNICIEYKFNGEPSGIAATQADYWVHELRRDGETLCYLMFPIERMKKVARHFHDIGSKRAKSGDGGKSEVVLIPLAEVLK